ncbi:DUF3717 domain-containing protein [Roseateles cellulosilyticus]|uniref:DUF3717 domain-containing protein n=1 Tax=Pelomonas cellulosilytica TaxID=2906762 RepID=A0ABS8Y092_9BURK|nr:DUF3717 domain-containing protein [Pelomonas sp. P8]MCE4557663.1 DUF3717 domain-containing protein [Pelomonas sp. P8]
MNAGGNHEPCATLAGATTVIHVTDLEAAINWWREHSPSPDGIRAVPEVRALAEAYALLSLSRTTCIAPAALPPLALDAWLAWYSTTPDSPCIAICSTAQGDPVCKGCGRTFDEVQHWPALSPFEKRGVWHRILLEGTAWRFNRYAERSRS